MVSKPFMLYSYEGFSAGAYINLIFRHFSVTAGPRFAYISTYQNDNDHKKTATGGGMGKIISQISAAEMLDFCETLFGRTGHRRDLGHIALTFWLISTATTVHKYLSRLNRTGSIHRAPEQTKRLVHWPALALKRRRPR